MSTLAKILIWPIAIVVAVTIWIPAFLIGYTLYVIGRVGVRILDRIGWGVDK